MDLKYFDIHAHIQFKDFDIDREEVVQRARDVGVGMINIATGLETSRQSIELAEKYDNCFAAVGLHPIYIDKEEFDEEKFMELAKNPKVVVIGECGIDLFHNKPETLPRQIEIFEKQLEIAREVGKPVMLHLRDGKEGESAYDIALEILKKYSEVRANTHFFAGTVDQAKKFIDMGHTISFTGVITFAKQYEELVRMVPLDRIMTETDCPYVAPVPYRGQRNEPSFVVEMYKKIAEIKGESLETVRDQIKENVRRVFAI